MKCRRITYCRSQQQRGPEREKLGTVPFTPANPSAQKDPKAQGSLGYIMICCLRDMYVTTAEIYRWEVEAQGTWTVYTLCFGQSKNRDSC